MTKRCDTCEGSMEGLRSHARFCSRTCKNRASQVRRTADGRVDNKARYENERERRMAYAREYHKTHPDASKIIRARRRARLRNAVHYDFTERDWQRLVRRYRGCCAYCGQRSSKLQREHVIPLCRGGTHGAGNILPACPTCNYRKHTSLLVEFRLTREGVIL